MIHKIGAVILRDKKIFVGKKKHKFIIPGGRIEAGENHEECLRRELQEEFRLNLVSHTLFGEYEAEAALDPGLKIKMVVYLVNVDGEPIPDNEITEAQYVNSQSDIKMGSIVEHQVIPESMKRGMIE
tara:strand:- start:152 stop:532 length:381 start_codon:yes stop_codon:yes gene_type:complete